MALVLKTLYSNYIHYFYDSIDERSEGWYLVESPPVSISMLLIGYVVMIKFGPELMEDRKAFELQHVMMIYNFLQVLVNLVMNIFGGYYFFIVHGFDFKCQGINFDSGDRGMAELKFTYAYLLLKIMDLLDTLFFVLTKKNSHLTFLHCYHHFFLVVGSYIGVRWLPGGHPIFLGYINTIVHAIMYFYYFLTAFKPELKQSFWWKKHITQVQMFQFGILAAAFLRASLAAGCTYPKFWLWVLVVQNTFFLVLFTDFYRKTYFKNTNKAH